MESLIDPEVDLSWTSDRELDRLAPLAESLHSWSGVYDQWRTHELAATRPEQVRFGADDLTAIDDLRGVHFGQLAAASHRLRQVGAAAARLAESTGLARSELAHAWPGGASQRLAVLHRDVQDCATRCAGLGYALEIAVIRTAAPVITSAVDEILARSDRFAHSVGILSRELCEQRIAELSVFSASRDAGAPAAHQVWRAELDTLITDYDAMLRLWRATLAEAASTITRIYQALGCDIASSGGSAFDGMPWGGTPVGGPGPVPSPSQVPGLDVRIGDVFTHGGAAAGDQIGGPTPSPTVLASVALAGDTDSAGDPGPSAGSSWASGGGSSDVAFTPGAPAPGSAVLGDLGRSGSPTPPGGAVLGSVPDDAPRYSDSVQYADGAGYGTSGVAPWAGSIHRDKEREVSCARSPALPGEQTEEYPEPDRTVR